MARCQCGEAFAMRGHECDRQRQLPRRRRAATNEAMALSMSAVFADINMIKLSPTELAAASPALLHCVGARIARGSPACRRRRLGNDLVQHFQPFRFQFLGASRTNAGDIAAGPVEAGNQAEPDRIVAGHEHDRHRRRSRLGCQQRPDCCCRRRARRQDARRVRPPAPAGDLIGHPPSDIRSRILVHDDPAASRRPLLKARPYMRFVNWPSAPLRRNRSPASPAAARARRAAKRQPRRQ